MNKKEYINPEMNVIEVCVPQLLADSDLGTGEYTGGGVDAPELDLDREVFGF